MVVEDAVGSLIMARANASWEMQEYGVSKVNAIKISKNILQDLADRKLLTDAICEYLIENPKTL